MRKLTAICFFLLFLFNLIGYRLVFYFAQQKATVALESKIDKEQYNESDLLVLRVDLNMPYQTMSSGYEKAEGEISVDGKVYKYIKRKVENGQLVLLCLPDQNKMKLQTAKNEFFKISNSLTHENDSDKSSKSSVAKNTFSDYEQIINEYPSLTLSVLHQFDGNYHQPRLLPVLSFTPEQPPELI